MDETIVEAFEAQARKTPNNIAVRDENRCLTYRELDCLATTIASRFPSKAQFVGIVMDHSAEMIASLLAILKIGAAYVPAEPSFPVERIRYMMKQSSVSFVITQADYGDLFDNTPLVFIEDNITAQSEATFEQVRIFPESAAYILYTSGTTGKPKGVVVEHRNVCHYVRAFTHEFNPTENDVMLQNSVCTFDIFVEEVFPLLLRGGSLAIPKATTRSDIDKLMNFSERCKVSIISGFPYLMHDIDKLGCIPSSLRLLISGGDVLRAYYVEHLIDKVELYNTYGPSETTVCATYFRCNGSSPLEDGTYPIGKAVLGSEVYLADQNLLRVKPGEIGEICIKGAGVSRGYLNDDEAMKSFVSLSDGSTLYRSGDIGRQLDDGTIAFLERKDQQVMILGRRVEPQEVENALSNCDGISQAAVISNTDEQGLAYLTAYVIPEDSVQVSHLREELSDHLPDYMIPDYFVCLDQMPLLASGKLDRSTLPTVLKEGALS